MPDASIDLVYSFIVFQHLPSFATLQRYLAEVRRVLVPAGVAQLYYGAYRQLRPMEWVRGLRDGYRELDVPVNSTSLVVTRRTMERACRRAGLHVVARDRSFRHVPDGYPRTRGRQRCVTLVRPL